MQTMLWGLSVIDRQSQLPRASCEGSSRRVLVHRDRCPIQHRCESCCLGLDITDNFYISTIVKSVDFDTYLACVHAACTDVQLA